MDNKAATQYLQSVVKDTPIEILVLQQAMWQEKSDEERLRITCEHIDSSRMIFENSIRRRNPLWSHSEVHIEVFRQTYENLFSKTEMENIIESIKKYHKTSLSNL